MRQNEREERKNAYPDLLSYSGSDLFACLSNLVCERMCACMKADVHSFTLGRCKPVKTVFIESSCSCSAHGCLSVLRAN